MKYFYALIIFTFILFQNAFATHIVGGEMTYTYNGGTSYTVTLTVYRDDINGSANALFDNPAYISIFNSAGTFITKYEPSYTFFDSEIDPPFNNPCLDQPSNIRIQQAKYVFNINVPTLTQGYHLVYSRCCRNGGLITNLNNPGNQGATYTAFIPPTSTYQNNSPVFNLPIPPLYICLGKPNTYDHSATDIDGDSLYYSFCAPSLGLDDVAPIIDQGSNPPTAQGGSPNNYGPPFNNVIYGTGYTSQNPFGGTSICNIDPNTGYLYIKPNISGFFVVGICVQEYRNGVLLSTVMRDFQYITADCDIPVADIPTYGSIPETEIGVDVPENFLGIYQKNCEDYSVTFDNISVLSNGAAATATNAQYYWNFGDGTSSTLFEPTHIFPDTGTYVTQLAITEGNAIDGYCSDTGYYVVFIYPLFDPEFEVENACDDANSNFIDISNTAAYDFVNEWNWSFGDGATSTAASPQHTYTSPGTYQVILFARTDKGCTKADTNTITIYPRPISNFTMPNNICIDDSLQVTNASSIVSGTITDYLWDFGNSQTSTQQNPTTIGYATAGTYNISLLTISNEGCRDSITKQLTINPLPTLTVNAQSPVCPNTTSQLNAVSSGNQFTWTPATMLSNASIANPVANMDTTPTWFYVEVTDNNGCQSNDSVLVDLFPLPDADAGPDTSVCLNAANVVSFNTTVQLQASGGVSYLWSPAAGLSSTTVSNPTASPTSTTDYAVRVTDANTCVNYDTVKVVVLNPALELIQVDVDSMCNGDTVYVEVIDLGNVTSYTWSPSSFVTDPSIREPGFYPPVTTSYTLQTVNYCYLDEDTIKIEVVSPPPVDAGPLDSICLGDAPYMLDAQPNTLALYQWTTTDASLSDASIPNPTVAPMQNTWYYVYAVDSIGTLACESNDSVEILVFEPPTLALHYPLDYPGYICLGDSVQLYATSNDGIYFNWSSNNGTTILSPTNDSTLVVPSDTTLFYQTVTNVHACSTTDSIQVAVQLPVTAMVSGDSTMCVGTFVNVAASGGLYYQWYPQQAGLFSNFTNSNTQAYPDSTITIFVDVSNDCFNDTAYHTITVYQLPTVDAGDNITINRDESDFLYGTGSGEPLWYTEDKTFDGILDLPNNYTIEVSPFNTTSYVLEVTDSITGCQNYDTALVNVNVLTLLAFPTGFSPNGNGTNDFAHIIKYLNIKQLNYLSIFDRWGELVYTSQDLDATGWDGTFKGRDCEVGTYIWVISAVTKDDENILRKGNITLIR